MPILYRFILVREQPERAAVVVVTAGSDHFRPDVLDLQEQGSPYSQVAERKQR